MTMSPLEIGRRDIPVRSEARAGPLELLTRPRRVVPFAFALLALVAVGDWFTGVEVAFTLLYIAPVGLVAWCCGALPGIAFAALATVGATVASMSLASTRPLLVVWNSLGTFGVLAVVAVALAKLRTYVECERRERRLAVEQLRRAERLNIIGKLAAGVAHELGTPLNVIQGSAELLQSRNVPPERSVALLDTIRAQTSRISVIVRHLLDFGRGTGTSKTPADLNQLAFATAALLQTIAMQRDCTLSFEPFGEAIPLVANASELEQVMTNLVLNGLHAMPGGGELRLRTCIERRALPGGREKQYGCVVVEDRGHGIAPEDLPRIFDPFFTTKEVGDGTGLGLSISYGIVQDHGGHLEVASREGGGTRFKVLVPLASEVSA